MAELCSFETEDNLVVAVGDLVLRPRRQGRHPALRPTILDDAYSVYRLLLRRHVPLHLHLPHILHFLEYRSAQSTIAIRGIAKCVVRAHIFLAFIIKLLL